MITKNSIKKWLFKLAVKYLHKELMKHYFTIPYSKTQPEEVF